MEIKCLAFDVDGTLTNDDKKIDERTKASIFEAMEQGIQIVISTGRNKQGCEWIYKELNLEKGNHYLLLINGQEIYDFKNKYNWYKVIKAKNPPKNFRKRATFN